MYDLYMYISFFFGAQNMIDEREKKTRENRTTSSEYATESSQPETEKSIKIAIRIRFDSIHSIFDSIRFGLLFEIHNSVRLDSTDSIFDSIRFDSTHPQQNIVFFVLCSTHYVRVQKRLSISP